MDLKEQIRQQLEENQKSKGFGDTFEKIMIFTGSLSILYGYS